MRADRKSVIGLLSVAFARLPFESERLAAFSRPPGSEVPRNAATANAAPHTNARAAVHVFKPLPTIPRTRPLITDKLTNVRTAVSHFMEISAGLASGSVAPDSVPPRQSPALYPGKIL